MFTKEERSTFKYWFAHWCAFQLVALSSHAWKPKYLLHDIEKPWLKLFWPYPKVQKWHRQHNNHHLEYTGKKKLDYEAMCIDWDCSRFTKSNSQLNAFFTFLWYLSDKENYQKIKYRLVGSGTLDDISTWDIVKALKKLGMWNSDIKIDTYSPTDLQNLKTGKTWNYNNSRIV